MNKVSFLLMILLIVAVSTSGHSEIRPMGFEQYNRENIPEKTAIDVLLNELSWAKFDPETRYKLGNYLPHDGMDKSSTISCKSARKQSN